MRTEERFLPRVHPFVPGQHRHQREPLGAVGALKRPLARVNPEVLHEHEAHREPFAALAALVGLLPGVDGQMPLHVRPASVSLLTMRAFELALHPVHLPVLRAREQGVEAFAALLAEVAFAHDVGLPVLQQLRSSGEALATDGADLREPTLLGVALLVMKSQRPQIGEGAPTQLTGERNGNAVMFTFMLCQIPGVLEGSLTLRAVIRSFSRVCELVPSDV